LIPSPHLAPNQAILARNKRIQVEDLKCIQEEKEVNAFVKEDYGSDTIRLESIRPSLLLSDGQPTERNVSGECDRQIDSRVEEYVANLINMTRGHGLNSKNIYLFFESLNDVTLLIKKVTAASKQQIESLDTNLNNAQGLEEPQSIYMHISFPVVKLAVECLDGHRDGLIEVFAGLALLRSLAHSSDHIETFNVGGSG
jgi:hypothetical protein